MQRFRPNKAIIGMIHIQALPGTPQNHLSIQQIIDHACREAHIYMDQGLDSILLENMHDIPYLNRQAPEEIIAAMTAVACAIRQFCPLPLGIQILAGANRAALAVALAANLNYIRAEGYVFGHLADEGYMDSDAGELLRYRKLIGADQISIFTDIRKKHSSHAITDDLSIAEIASAAEFFLSDGLIITGSSTGKAANPAELKTVREASSLPILIGSGITAKNIDSYWDMADGFIIGSYFKEDGNWIKPLSGERISLLMDKVRVLREI